LGGVRVERDKERPNRERNKADDNGWYPCLRDSILEWLDVFDNVVADGAGRSRYGGPAQQREQLVLSAGITAVSSVTIAVDTGLRICRAVISTAEIQ